MDRRAYLELVDSLVEPYFEATAERRLRMCNKAFEEQVGDVRGRLVEELFHADCRDIVRSLCDALLTGGERSPLSAAVQWQPAGGGGEQTVRLQLSRIEHSSDGGTLLRGHLMQAQAAVPAAAVDDDTRRALERQAEELGILNHLAEAISSSLELDDILHSICREMVWLFNARNVGIALLNRDRTGLKVVAFHTNQPEESDITGLEFELEGNDASLFVIKTGEPIVVPDAQHNPITRSLHEVMRKRGTSCLMVVPLLARGEVIGTIGMPSNSLAIFTPEEVRLAETIAVQVASVIDNARLHQSVKRARDVAERELEIGRQIQTGFFPERLPQLPGWLLDAHFQSARQVSGDFYDAFPLGAGRVGLVLADVCDKGVGAALFMVLFRSLLRANLQNQFAADRADEDPGETLRTAVGATNNYVAITHAQANMFATVFAAVLAPDSGALWYVNCGHDAPVLGRFSGRVERLTPTGPAIGMFADLTLASGWVEMKSGDALFAFTDGVTDARSAAGAAFGERHLLSILTAKSPMRQRLGQLRDALKAHTAGTDQYDDITCVAVEKTAPHGPVER